MAPICCITAHVDAANLCCKLDQFNDNVAQQLGIIHLWAVCIMSRLVGEGRI